MSKILAVFTAIVATLFSFGHVKKTATPVQPTTTAQLAFKPNVEQIGAAQDFTTTLNFHASDDFKTQGYRFVLNFDPAKLQLKHIEYKLGTVSQDLGQTDNNLENINQSGKIIIQGEIPSANGYSVRKDSDLPVVSFTFNASTADTSRITLDTNQQNFFVKINPDLTLGSFTLSADNLKVN